jgi:hypothetical protein
VKLPAFSAVFDAFALTFRTRFMFMRLWSVAAMLSFFGGLPSNTATAGEPELRRRFETEAPRQWKAYVEFAKHLQGSHETTCIDRLASNKVTSVFRLERKQNSSCMSNQQEDLGQEPRGTCWVKNGTYAFQLTRKGNQKPWAISQIKTDPGDGDNSFLGMLTKDACGPCPLLLFRGWLPELVEKPGFRVLSVKDLPRGGQNFAQIEFSYTLDENEKKEKGLIYMEKGSFILDPNRYWAVCEYDVTTVFPTDGKVKVHYTAEFRDNGKGFPILTKGVSRLQEAPPNGKRIDAEHRDEYQIEEGYPGFDAFTLTAYGLPEPFGVHPPSPSRLYVWVGIVGAICLLVATFFWRRVRKPA